MSSAHRSRVLSPVVIILTSSTLTLRTWGFPLCVGVGTGVTEVDCLRTDARASVDEHASAGRLRTWWWWWWFSVGWCFGARCGFRLVDVVFPLFDDLLCQVGDVFRVVSAKFANGETRLALLRNVACTHDHTQQRWSGMRTLSRASLT